MRASYGATAMPMENSTESGSPVRSSSGASDRLKAAGKVGHFAEGLVLIGKQDKRTGAAVDGHIVLAGEAAEDGPRVLKEKVFPAAAVALFDFAEVAEIHENEGL